MEEGLCYGVCTQLRAPGMTSLCFSQSSQDSRDLNTVSIFKNEENEHQGTFEKLV